MELGRELRFYSSVASASQECHLATGAAVAARLAGVGAGRAKPAWCVAGCAVCLGRAAPPFSRVLWGLWRIVLGPEMQLQRVTVLYWQKVGHGVVFFRVLYTMTMYTFHILACS